jgi:hypothetical protein
VKRFECLEKRYINVMNYYYYYYYYIFHVVYTTIKLFLCPDVSMPREEGSEDEVSMSSLQECPSTSQVQNRSVSAKKRGKLWGLLSLLGQSCSFIFLGLLLCFLDSTLEICLSLLTVRCHKPDSDLKEAVAGTDLVSLHCCRLLGLGKDWH